MIFLAVLLGFQMTSALADPTFGTEFNFGNEKINAAWAAQEAITGDASVLSAEESKAAEKMATYVRKICGDCTVTEHSGKHGAMEYAVKFPDGWGFNISVDPACVEIQTEPATTEQLKNQSERIQKFIFEPARRTGLQTQVASDIESGLEMTAHLNIGLRSAFEDDPRGLMRFIVDYSNHPGLGQGILGNDAMNAPIMSTLDSDQRAAFIQLVNDVNSGAVNTTDEIIRRMNFYVYTKTPLAADPLPAAVADGRATLSFWERKARAETARHYQAIGMKQLIKPEYKTRDMPFELRAIRQPKNAREYLRMTELMDARIKFLKSQGDRPIRFVDADRIEVAIHSESALVQAVEFVLYVEEAGLAWRKYQTLASDYVRDELNSGVVGKILKGDIDWASNAQRNSFTEAIVSQSLFSENAEKRLLRILKQKRTPPDAWTLALQTLLYKARKSPNTAAHTEVLVEKIITLSQATKIDLETVGGVAHYLSEIQKLREIQINVKAPSFWERCRNLFRRAS
jgi:hypothetical protein